MQDSGGPGKTFPGTAFRIPLGIGHYSMDDYVKNIEPVPWLHRIVLMRCSGAGKEYSHFFIESRDMGPESLREIIDEWTPDAELNFL